MYIYGLNAKETNEKVKVIYEIWSANVNKAAEKVGKDKPERIIVKNSKTINFLLVVEYPHRRLQVSIL
jgi:hypothetical protein